MKAIDAATRVAKRGTNGWTVRFSSAQHLDAVRSTVAALGLVVLDTEVEGSQWDWSYCVVVGVES